MRPTFGREYIENEFQRIGDGLSEPLTVYLIGGGAMSLRDLKGATKDIDLVVPDGDAYGQLWAVLMDLGYAEVHRWIQITGRWGRRAASRTTMGVVSISSTSRSRTSSCSPTVCKSAASRSSAWSD